MRAFLRCGHYSERVAAPPMIQTHAECPWGCGVQVIDDEPISDGPANVIPDYPEHYSLSFDAVVKSRQHHKQLQRERGTQDYEPVGHGGAGYEASRSLARKRGRVIFNG